MGRLFGVLVGMLVAAWAMVGLDWCMFQLVLWLGEIWAVHGDHFGMIVPMAFVGTLATWIVMMFVTLVVEVALIFCAIIIAATVVRGVFSRTPCFFYLV